MTEELVLPRRLSPDEFADRRENKFDAQTEILVKGIVDRVREGGEASVRAYAEELDSLDPGAPLFLTQVELKAAFDSLPAEDQQTLNRIAERIRAFAQAQKSSLTELDVEIPGGRAGHTIVPVSRAGCYAPGGRYPLPSSVLMTVIPARVAGVEEVWVATPNGAPLTLAAAWIAGADGALVAGGAHAIAALAFGAGPIEPMDVIVGPGNQWVTAAKKYVSGDVRIDMLAGPSELIIIADGSSDPAMVAADLLAQAEHDDEAFPFLISLDARLIEQVENALANQLNTLPSAITARNALQNGGVALVGTIEEAAQWSDQIAPEHLQICTRDPDSLVNLVSQFGALFIGSQTAEVFGDYGAGPNHVLPTNGTARSTGGLSVFTFLKIQTWMQMNDDSYSGADAAGLLDDVVWFAREEGLEAHARAAKIRSATR